MGIKEIIKQVFVKRAESEYGAALSRKKVEYDSWVKRSEALCVSGIPERQQQNPSDVEKVSSSVGREYVLFRQERGVLSEHADRWIGDYFRTHPQVQVLYGDEDFLNPQGKRENPWYKPCWSPDTYQSQFYVGSVAAVRRQLLPETVGEVIFSHPDEILPVLTECIRKAGGFAPGCGAIAGCGKVLFHVTDPAVWEEYLSCNCGQIIQNQEPAVDNYPQCGNAAEAVSVIIPSKDNPGILQVCLKSLEKIRGLEIVIVDNGSCEENRCQIEQMVRSYGRIKYLYHPMDFNFSRMCNLGVEASAGKYLLFLNDDIEVCGGEWLQAMLKKAALPYVGAVGLKLYYPNSLRIQHGGITSLPVGPVHKMQFLEDRGSIYFDRNKGAWNCIAVTGACLLIDRRKYLQVGGLKETLQVAYNDVELGFALYEAGYHNVVLNDYYAYHHESLSRGSDETPQKQERLRREREKLYEMHPALKQGDPYYPPGLTHDGLDVRILPAYIQSMNRVQAGTLRSMRYDPDRIRVDQCVLLGIELSRPNEIRGYGVVLGDNNACYDRYVVLAESESTEQVKMSEPREFHPDHIYMIKTEPQYRQDLEENLADQQNVALCGFHVCLEGQQPAGPETGREYRVGVLAVHKINKGQLLNWSLGRFSLK